MHCEKPTALAEVALPPAGEDEVVVPRLAMIEEPDDAQALSARDVARASPMSRPERRAQDD
jgi:hypothetical protein